MACQESSKLLFLWHSKDDQQGPHHNCHHSTKLGIGSRDCFMDLCRWRVPQNWADKNAGRAMENMDGNSYPYL